MLAIEIYRWPISDCNGVSPRNTRLRGQSIIEYVLIIAVIGLVIVFAGPGVTSAIRNQFNLVGNTLNNGMTGGVEGGASGGGSTGADSATVQTAVAKDAKDWTLEEQEAVAKDIAKNGTSSIAYAKAKAAMDAGTKFTLKLTNGKTLTYRIIGINHDDLADGSGKAGLTFLTTSMIFNSRMNATATNAGGWEKSELRQKMNSGYIWGLMPSELQSKVKSIKKFTNNVGGTDKNAAVTPTVDKLFCLSDSEIVNADSPRPGWDGHTWISKEGAQYEAFIGKVTRDSDNAVICFGDSWWMRSANPGSSSSFNCVDSKGEPSHGGYTTGGWTATLPYVEVCPAWCF